MKYLIIILFFLWASFCVHAQDQKEAELEIPQELRLNFFISSRTKKMNFAMKSSQFQARILSKAQKNFYCIIVDSASEMSSKIISILVSRKAKIGSIWFDSHGHFSRRYSSFEIGSTEFSYKAILDGSASLLLAPIIKYCDSQTKVGIGSCYGGASFTLPVVEEFHAQRMNGDSLVRGLSKILNGARVFGSESFVMSRPGMFFSKYALAGVPSKKKFADPIYQPVWQNLGKWNSYDSEKDLIQMVGTVKIDVRGEIHCEKMEYLSFGINKKKLRKKIAKLKKGNYDIGYFYQSINEKNTASNE